MTTEATTPSVIERLLARQQEQCCRLTDVKKTDDDIWDLENLWAETNSQVFYVFADYPTHENTYEQTWSGVECKFISSADLYICVDETDGYYLASNDTVDEWDLRDSKKAAEEEAE